LRGEGADSSSGVMARPAERDDRPSRSPICPGGDVATLGITLKIRGENVKVAKVASATHTVLATLATLTEMVATLTSLTLGRESERILSAHVSA
jgi:hypothetical protein